MFLAVLGGGGGGSVHVFRWVRLLVSSVLFLACLPVFFWSACSSRRCPGSEFTLVKDVFSLGHIQGHLSLAAVGSLHIQPSDKAFVKSGLLGMKQTAPGVTGHRQAPCSQRLVSLSGLGRMGVRDSTGSLLVCGVGCRHSAFGG